ncbi:MAG: hypothetical protein JNN07_19720 [Verrucomicrobiales bacterium]|nr:hypothetical protein [Verrucomicrobiales bacterium]
MKSVSTQALSVLALAAGAYSSTQAAEGDHLSRWGLRAKFGFNLKADFSDARPTTAAAPAAPGAGGGIDRNYDDGYVRVDSNGNAGGATWNWGYDNNTQYDPAGAGSILMHATTSSTSEASKGAKSDGMPGWELSYGRDIGKLGESFWGIEGAIGMGLMDISDRRARNGTLTQITDTFGLGGIIPPGGPYGGSFIGPGPLLDDVPSGRTTSTTAGTIRGSRDLEATLVSLRFGPYLHYPAGDKWAFSLSAGPALTLVNADFSYRDTFAAGGTTSGSDSDSSVSFGAYIDGRVHYSFNEKWSMFGGLQYQYLQGTTIRAQNKQAKLSMSAGLWLELGVGYTY